jgi:hypothetical protein
MGPVLVLKIINDLNYLLQGYSQKTQKVVHHNKLLPYKGRQRPSWIVVACKHLPQSSSFLFVGQPGDEVEP